MGSSISIVNETDEKLHICLKQVTPLYFKNDVVPGDRFSAVVGKVWFTIEVRHAREHNKYDKYLINSIVKSQTVSDRFRNTFFRLKDIAVPIGLISTAAIGVAVSVCVAIAMSSKEEETHAKVHTSQTTWRASSFPAGYKDCTIRRRKNSSKSC